MRGPGRDAAGVPGADERDPAALAGMHPAAVAKLVPAAGENPAAGTLMTPAARDLADLADHEKK